MTTRVKSILMMMLLAGAAGCTKLCHSGYEGTNCNTLMKAKFIGAWTVTLPPTGIAYIDTISDAPGITSVTISHAFAGYAFVHSISAVVSNSNITISLQQPDSGVAKSVLGSGTINSPQNAISWTYQIISAQDTTSYSETWTR